MTPSRYPPYPDYRASGVDWLGEIPSHWEMLTLKQLAKIIDGDRGLEYPNVADYVAEGIPFLSSKNIVNGQIKFDEIVFIPPDKFQRLREGKLEQEDLVITVRGTIGNSALFRSDLYSTGFINAQMMIVRPDRMKVDPAFLFSLATSNYFQESLALLAYGTAQQQLSNKILSSIPLPMPVISEQRAIADFLDRETARLDALIDAKRRLIELLKEKRAALISHVVTRGLDPNVPMKDSGIEWLGEIPAHWEVKPLKFIAQVRSGVAKGRKLEGQETVELPYMRGQCARRISRPI